MATYKIKNYYGKYLNIYGDNVTYLEDNQVVTLWTGSNTNEQKWEISAIGTGVYVKSVIDTDYALNYYWADGQGEPGNCDVYPWSGNSYDAKVNFIADGNYYRIKLTNYNLYLTAESNSDGANVSWEELGTTTSARRYQQWKCEEVTTSSSSGLGQAVDSFDDLRNLSATDLIARCIYTEARGETDSGKRGVACVIRNRRDYGTDEFGGNTYAGVVLKDYGFEGMTTAEALAPDTTEAAWQDCVNIANNIENISNPIGDCLWFVTTSHYNNNSYTYNGDEYFRFNANYDYTKVTEKVTIGGHVFFLLENY